MRSAFAVACLLLMGGISAHAATPVLLTALPADPGEAKLRHEWGHANCVANTHRENTLLPPPACDYVPVKNWRLIINTAMVDATCPPDTRFAYGPPLPNKRQTVTVEEVAHFGCTELKAKMSNIYFREEDATPFVRAWAGTHYADGK